MDRKALEVSIAKAKRSCAGIVVHDNVNEKSITVHLGFVKGPKHLHDGKAMVDEGGSAVRGRMPVGGSNIGDGEARSNPRGILEEFEVVRYHFLEEDDDREIRCEGANQRFEVAKSARHANWPSLGLIVDVPSDESDSAHRGWRNFPGDGLPRAISKGVSLLRFRLDARVGHAKIQLNVHLPDRILPIVGEVKRTILVF